MTNDYNIYVLFDPRIPSEYRYVGATRKTSQERLSAHLNDAKIKPNQDDRCRWMAKIIEEGHIPKIKIIRSCNDFQVERMEQEFIELFSKTHPLTNSKRKCAYMWQLYGDSYVFGESGRPWIKTQIERARAMQVRIKLYPLTTDKKVYRKYMKILKWAEEKI